MRVRGIRYVGRLYFKRDHLARMYIRGAERRSYKPPSGVSTLSQDQHFEHT